MDEIKVNLEIPGYIKHNDLEFLGATVKALPQNAVLIDVGCGWGREAWVFSKNAPPSATIHCLDIWGWPPTWKYVFKGKETLPESDRNLKNSMEEFLSFTADCPNITAHKADKNAEWAGPPADFIFYDEEDEVEESIIPKLRHWNSRLKPGGILCGTDFYPYSSVPVKTGLISAVRKCVAEFGKVLVHDSKTSIWLMVETGTLFTWMNAGKNDF